MTTHLIIPDQHAHPDHNNDRFDWLGKLIVDLKPDVVVNLGDLADMPSLSSYDKGTKGFEGRRYRKDIDSAVEASDRMFKPIKKAKKKRPRFVFTMGNHEDRISRAVNADAMLDGTIGLNDLMLEDYGYEVYPFLEPVVIDGIAYSHYFTSGVMGRPISGVNPARSLLLKLYTSATCGHSHLIDFSTAVDVSGRRIMGLTAGAYQDYYSGWNNPQSEAMWWSGVIIKRHVDNGSYEPQFVSIETIFREYGK